MGHACRSPLAKGEAQPLEEDEAALLCEQTLESRELLFLCAHCRAPAAPLRLQLALALRRVRRSAAVQRAERPGGWRAEGGLGHEPDEPVVCGDGCTEVWCSADCRRSHQSAHRLTCVRGVGSAHPMSELHSMSRAVNETLILAAKAICARIAAAMSHAKSDADLANTAQAEAAKLLAACAAAGANACGPDSNVVEETSQEAWCLLHATLIERLPCGAHEAVASLLAQRVYCDVVASFERSLLTVVVDSPIVARCAELVVQHQADTEPVLGTLLDAARCVLSSGHSSRLSDASVGHMSMKACASASTVMATAEDVGADSEEQLDALLLEEAIAAASEVKHTPMSSTAEHKGDVVSTARRVTNARRAPLLHQRAPSLFSEACGQFAFLLPGGNPAHSCLPNVQIEALPLSRLCPSGSSSAFSEQTARGFGAREATSIPQSGWRMGALALRNLAQAEPLTVSWIDSSAPLPQRRRQLQLRFGEGYSCPCIRCQFDSSSVSPNTFRADNDCSALACAFATSQQPSMPWLELAVAAVQEGRYESAAVLARRQINASGGANGEAAHLLGACWLARGDIVSAREAWEAGMKALRARQVEESAAMDDDGGLAATWAKCEKYAQAEHMPAGMIHSTPGDLPGSDVLFCEAGVQVVCSSAPLLSVHDCDACVALAEDRAAQLGGWSTSRHYAVPTTDIPVHECEQLMSWFATAFRTRISPWLEAELGLPTASIAVHDAFVVKYSSEAQRLLPLHTDESSLSFTIPLNCPREYDGGGTYFWEMRRAIRPPKGSLIAFDGGKLLHGGEPVVAGTRYILAAFLYLKNARACERNVAIEHLHPVEHARRAKRWHDEQALDGHKRPTPAWLFKGDSGGGGLGAKGLSDSFSFNF